ncbi:signal peptide peptidase-like, aspartyl protease family A22B [Thraustotheca clavata]|uniref:Signal peptide peptidase-like, aspartyl protease family A22B n=1 Tax=Thraustotheca clavata TaxID=74557 RepID=A0A1V9Z4C0_9STRA|nr:signal peptide peptidase-like, aspartyl protease family A22B [Thraustotheca clavata]
MIWKTFVAFFTSIAAVCAIQQKNVSLALLEITTSVAKDARSVYVTPSLFGPPLPPAVTATSYHLFVLAEPLSGCVPLTNNVSGKAVLLNRGDCAFDVKVWYAQEAGAALVLVRDTPAAALEHPDQIDCTIGSGEYCEDSASCVSSTCVFSPLYQMRCCVDNVLISMSGVNASRPITIPSVYLSVLDGQLVENYMIAHGQEVFATVWIPVNQSPWNISMILMWALGVVVVMYAAYHSAAKEREWSRHIVATAMEATPLTSPTSSHQNYYTEVPSNAAIDDNSEDDQPLQLTAKHAGLFLVMGSCMLLLMFYIHALVLIQLVFAAASSFCVTYLITYPLAIMYISSPLVAFGVGLIPSFALVVVWFVYNSNPWIWILQDAFGICLCVVFVDSIQLPSLQIAVYLLAAAFFYDVFFVYISPFVFGSNVMVDVASRVGEVSSEINGKLAIDFCTRHPESVSCGHSTVPLVLSLPLIHSIYGGSSLLGLGDLVLPALLVSFGLRVDYCTGRPLHLKHSYYVHLCIAYAIGLLAANVMSIVLQEYVAGQPALMYIVPIMLGTIVYKAKADGEFDVLWHGPAFFV